MSKVKIGERTIRYCVPMIHKTTKKFMGFMHSDEFVVSMYRVVTQTKDGKIVHGSWTDPDKVKLATEKCYRSLNKYIDYAVTYQQLLPVMVGFEPFTRAQFNNIKRGKPWKQWTDKVCILNLSKSENYN